MTTGQQAEAGVWREIEYGEHDWHRPDPMKNKCCRRCGLYDAAWTGDGCPKNPVRQRAHQVGPWEPFGSPDPPPLAELVTDEDVQVARAAYLRAGELGAGMRAALEAYGARLLARHERTT